MNRTFVQVLFGLFLCPNGENVVQGRFNSNCGTVLYVARDYNFTFVLFPLPVTEYYKMPKLYIMDDYDLCMDQPDNVTVYCIATVIIKPNQTLPLWEYIDEFSRNRKKHFRHDRLQRGICVNKCSGLLADLDEDTLEGLYQPEFEYENEVRLSGSENS